MPDGSQTIICESNLDIQYHVGLHREHFWKSLATFVSITMAVNHVYHD